MARFVVGTETFPSKKALTERCREILYKYEVSRPIQGADHLFLLALLQRHRQATQKAGAGVAHFFVQLQLPYKTRGFCLRRVDGSETDFSFIACISPPSKRQEVLKGFRTAVQDDIIAYKVAAFGKSTHVTCEATSKRITFQDAHVDHKPPLTFVDLVDDFLAERGITVEDVPVNPTTDGDVVTEILDASLREAFRTYHNTRAVLRILSKTANLQRVP